MKKLYFVLILGLISMSSFAQMAKHTYVGFKIGTGGLMFMDPDNTYIASGNTSAFVPSAGGLLSVEFGVSDFDRSRLGVEVGYLSAVGMKHLEPWTSPDPTLIPDQELTVNQPMNYIPVHATYSIHGFSRRGTITVYGKFGLGAAFGTSGLNYDALVVNVPNPVPPPASLEVEVLPEFSTSGSWTAASGKALFGLRFEIVKRSLYLDLNTGVEALYGYMYWTDDADAIDMINENSAHMVLGFPLHFGLYFRL